MLPPYMPPASTVQALIGFVYLPVNVCASLSGGGARRKKKMNLSHTQAVGFNNDIVSLFTKVTVVLDAAGLKTAQYVQNMKSLQEQVETANANQESLKRQQKDATENYGGLKGAVD